MLVKKSVLEKVEEELGRWGIFKGPKKYLEIVLEFLKGESVGLRILGDVLDLKRGLTTNANELFYLKGIGHFG